MIKLSLLLIILCLLALEVCSEDDKEVKVRTKGEDLKSSEVSDYFSQWKAKNGEIVSKVNSNEMGYRELVFKGKVKEIHRHNSDDSRTYDKGLN